MRINVNALAKAFFREWEISTLPADFPDELNIIIKMVDYWLSTTPDYSKMSVGEKEILTEKEANLIFLDKLSEERITTLHNAQEELYSLKEDLQNKGVPAEDIQEIFKTVMEDII